MKIVNKGGGGEATTDEMSTDEAGKANLLYNRDSAQRSSFKITRNWFYGFHFVLFPL